MRVKSQTCRAGVPDPRERIVLTLELPKNSIYSATFSGNGNRNPTRVAVKVENARAEPRLKRRPC